MKPEARLIAAAIILAQNVRIGEWEAKAAAQKVMELLRALEAEIAKDG